MNTNHTNGFDLMLRWISLTLLLVLSLNVQAETLFVGDTLRVGIRPEPTKAVPSISVIKTGAAVEILERKNSYVKVRTKSGVEGWVKSAYLTSKTPAFNKLKIANHKIKDLENQLSDLKKRGGKDAAESQKKLNATIKELQVEKIDLLKKISALKSQPATAAKTESTQLRNPFVFNLNDLNTNFVYFVLGGIAALLVLGFLFGVSWYKQQVTKRLGGLSI